MISNWEKEPAPSPKERRWINIKEFILAIIKKIKKQPAELYFVCLMFVIMLYMGVIYKDLIVNIMVLLTFIILICSDKIGRLIEAMIYAKMLHKQELQQQKLEVIPSLIAEMLFNILQGNSHRILGVVPPQTISDILPIDCPVVQDKGDLTFYRFILYKAESHRNSTKAEVRRYLNGFIKQELKAQRVSIEPPFYRDMPSIYVSLVQDDVYLPDYYALDIIYICEEKNYIYAKNVEIQERRYQKLIENQELSEGSEKELIEHIR